MNDTEIIKKLSDIFTDIFDEEITVKDDMTAEDVTGWDSLAHVMLISSIEKDFGIKFSMDEVVSMNNVGDIIKSIKAKIL